MHEKFQAIKESYDQFYRSLLKRGKLPFKDTGKGFWNAADTPTLYELFSKIGTHKKFVDLGSGDGKAVLLASLFAKHAVGIEWDKELHNAATEFTKKLGINNVSFINDDFNNHALHEYDVVFLNPDKPLHRDNLEEKLVSELNGKLVVFGPHFHPTKLKKVNEFFVNDYMVSVYSK